MISRPRSYLFICMCLTSLACNEGKFSIELLKSSAVSDITITALSTSEGTSGDTVKVTGNNLNQNIALTLGDTSLDMEFINSQEVSFLLPSSRPGVFVLKVESEGMLLYSAPFVIQGDEFPTILANPNNICSNVQFFDKDGKLTTGKLICRQNLELCSTTIMKNCIATGNFVSFDKNDINSADIATGKNIGGIVGKAVVVCAHEDEFSCEADTACEWHTDKCILDSWQIRKGVTIGGTVGSIKTNCVNAFVDNTVYNSDLPVDNNTDTTGVDPDWWDGILFEPNWQSSTTTPNSWNSENICDTTDWIDTTADGNCDSPLDDCIFQNRISNLFWSESNPVTGASPDTTGLDWSSAVDHCNQLNFGGYSDWRLPTLNELRNGVNQGLPFLGYYAGTPTPGDNFLRNNPNFISNVNLTFYSATSLSGNTASVWSIYLPSGFARIEAKTTLDKTLVCIR